nr:uncharacterized protein LOC112012701 [Quercus suber]
MEMTQMRREDDDMIELHKTPGSRCRDDTLMEITIQGGDDIVDRYNASAKTTQSRKKWWMNLLKHLKYGSNWVEENRGYIMVVATVITTITFQQAASPLSGVWPQSGNVTYYSGYNIEVDDGMSVASSIDSLYYFYFMIFNVISFIASVFANFLLISGFKFKNKICMGLLRIALCTNLAFLVITYITAVSMVTPLSIYALKYKGVFNIREWVLGSFVVEISLVFLLHLIRFLVWLGRRIRKSIPAWVKAIHKLNC